MPEAISGLLQHYVPAMTVDWNLLTRRALRVDLSSRRDENVLPIYTTLLKN